MPYLEAATKLLKDPEERENVEKLFIDYLPDMGHKNFSAEEIGGDINQEAETEYELGWHMTLSESGSPILISHNATEFRIKLKGEEGWKHCEKLLDDYCRTCYSSKRIGTEGRCTTPEDFAQLSGQLRKVGKDKLYILAKKLKSRVRIYVACVCHGKKDFRTLRYLQVKEDYELFCSIRPIVTLPDDIKLQLGDEIYDGSTPERGLQLGADEIITGVHKQQRISYLKQEIEETKKRLKSLQDELADLEHS